MGLRTQDYDELGFTNDFMFAKVMRNRKLCKQLLEVILNVRIERIDYPEEQKTIDHSIDARSVRLDVYIKDDMQTVYNVEMQATNPKNLPKRSRYYQGMIDLNLIQKGDDFNKLNKSYVIFICTEDIFGKGRHIYTFENLCIQDTRLGLNDETTKVFLNPVSDMDDVDKELKNFLMYVANGKPVDNFTRELEREVEDARKNKGWEEEYMTLRMIEHEKYNEGLNEGISQGKAGSLVNSVDNLIKNLGLSLEEACTALGSSVQEYERAKELLKEQ